MTELPEGYFTVDRIDLDEDCDFGPCKGYVVEKLNLIFYTYDNDPTRVSFHPLDTMIG